MGSCGAGKTSLINNLCKKSHPTGMTNGESMTREIDFQDVVFVPGDSFRVYDTPGTNSVNESLQHAMILRASLTSLPVNLLMISVGLHSRYNKTFNELKSFLQIFKGYEKYVVCMVSQLDSLDKQANKKQFIANIAAALKNEFSNGVILYSNLTSDFKKLS